MRALHLILLVAALPLAATALAQPGAAPPEPTASAEARPPRPARAARLAELRGRLLRDRVGLDDAKASQVEAILAQDVNERRAARAQLAEARRELHALFASDSDDQPAWAAALAKMREARDATERLRDREYDALAKVLTPKEQAKLLRAMERVQGHARAERRKRGAPKNPYASPPGRSEGRRGKGPRKGSVKDPFGRR